jgi:hypothetical protein
MIEAEDELWSQSGERMRLVTPMASQRAVTHGDKRAGA